MTPQPPTPARPRPFPVAVVPGPSRTGWESVSDWFETHFLNSRERT